MILDINLLKTVSNYSKLIGLSRQHVYRLAQNEEITIVKVDGVSFVYLDSKANSFTRKRKEKSKKGDNI